MGMDIQVVLEDSEGSGILRCRLEEVKDPSGVMGVLKAVKFRVELQAPSPQRGEGAPTAVLTLIHEKGSIETFKEIYKRLTRDWKLDVVDSIISGEVAGTWISGSSARSPLAV